MGVRFLNCFTCNARYPAAWRSGALCLLVETNDGLALVHTGPGLDDYMHKTAMVRIFQVITKVPLDPEESALRQIQRLGHARDDVRHIVLTHMHFDHCGGLPDFPDASVHVHMRECAAFRGPPRRWTDLAYVRRHIAHKPRFVLYEDGGDNWFDFPAIRLPFDPEMWLVPLFGHTRGHCGVAVQTKSGWLLDVGDAGPMGLDDYTPAWMVRLAPGASRGPPQATQGRPPRREGDDRSHVVGLLSSQPLACPHHGVIAR